MASGKRGMMFATSYRKHILMTKRQILAAEPCHIASRKSRKGRIVLWNVAFVHCTLKNIRRSAICCCLVAHADGGSMHMITSQRSILIPDDGPVMNCQTLYL